MSEALPLVLGTVWGLIAGVAVVLGLLIGVCVALGLPKLRSSGRRTRVVRGLDELMGRPEVYLPPDAPRGPVDQLRTPELLESTARKSA